MKPQREVSDLLVDRRWNGNTGIGRYSRELIPRISPLIAGYLDDGDPVSMKQMGLSLIKGCRFTKFYSPGYFPLLGNIRQFITIHDLILIKPEIVGISKSIFFNKIVLPRIKDGQVQVITVSKSSQQEIAEWANIESENISIVPNGLSLDIIQAGKKLAIYRPPKSLVFVGNMKKHKNYLLFVEAVNMLPGSWNINVVGPNLDSHLLHTRHNVQSYTNITDRELAQIYARSSILVNTSSYEGFGMSFLEGGYLGCRIVHLGVLPTVEEILGQDSFHTGGSNSAKDLSDLIDQVSRENQIHESRRFLADTYSWDTSSQILKRTLSDL